jgi:uncharacterized membrane protein
MTLIKTTLLYLLVFCFSSDAFAQRATQADIYGDYGGGDGGIVGSLALIVFVGLVVWGFLTNRGFRLGVIGYAAYLGSIMFIFNVFGKEWGLIACAISIVLLLINDPAFKKDKDSSATNKANDLNKNNPNEVKQFQDVIKSKSANSFDNSSYPAPEIMTTGSNQTSKLASQTKAKEKSDDGLIQGNIKCCDCGYQDAPRNFLESDVGELYRKCPKCNMSWQVLTPPSNFGNYRCSGCGLEGDKGAFFPSSAGKDYLCCVKCNTHFQRNY